MSALLSTPLSPAPPQPIAVDDVTVVKPAKASPSSARLWQLGAVVLVAVGAIVAVVLNLLPSPPLHALPPRRLASTLGVDVPISMEAEVLAALAAAAKTHDDLGGWVYEPIGSEVAAREYLLTHPHVSKYINTFVQVMGADWWRVGEARWRAWGVCG